MKQIFILFVLLFSPYLPPQKKNNKIKSRILYWTSFNVLIHFNNYFVVATVMKNNSWRLSSSGSCLSKATRINIRITNSVQNNFKDILKILLLHFIDTSKNDVKYRKLFFFSSLQLLLFFLFSLSPTQKMWSSVVIEKHNICTTTDLQLFLPRCMYHSGCTILFFGLIFWSRANRC